MYTDDAPEKTLKAGHGSVPAWIGSGGVAVILAMQALGFDLSAVTGRGIEHRLSTIERDLANQGGRMDRLWNDTNIQRTRLSAFEADTRILFERIDTGARDRAEIKVSTSRLADAMANLAQSMVRIETKLDLVDEGPE